MVKIRHPSVKILYFQSLCMIQHIPWRYKILIRRFIDNVWCYHVSTWCFSYINLKCFSVLIRRNHIWKVLISETFLSVQDSSIGDLVTDQVSQCTFDFRVLWVLQSCCRRRRFGRFSDLGRSIFFDDFPNLTKFTISDKLRNLIPDIEG